MAEENQKKASVEEKDEPSNISRIIMIIISFILDVLKLFARLLSLLGVGFILSPIIDIVTFILHASWALAKTTKSSVKKKKIDTSPFMGWIKKRWKKYLLRLIPGFDLLFPYTPDAIKD